MKMESTNQETEKYLVDFISSNFGPDSDSVYSAKNFFQEGLIDSFGFMQLITEIENVYGITFSQEELMADSFINLKGILQIIEEKKTKPAK